MFFLYMVDGLSIKEIPVSMLLVLSSARYKNYTWIQLQVWRYFNHNQFMIIYIFLNEIVISQEKRIYYLFTAIPHLPFLSKIYILNLLLWTKEDIYFKETCRGMGMKENSCQYISDFWEYKKLGLDFYCKKMILLQGEEKDTVYL